MGLQQLGVIPFEIRSLKIGHTEQRRTQRFYIVAIVRHRGTVGAWRNRGYLRVFIKVLQQFGVISFEIRTLMYCHTEQRRTQRFYIAEIVRHRGTVGTWSIRGYLWVLKTFITKAISNTYTTALSLFVPSAPPWVCLLSPLCSSPLSVPFICSRLTLSLHISEEPNL